MSGGSYEYAYSTVERFADALDSGERFDGQPADGASSLLRAGFAAHLRKVAAAMKAIEWEDSFDTSPPLADEAIQHAIGALGQNAEAIIAAAKDKLEKQVERNALLEAAIFDLVNMERTRAPDMGGKRRTYAFMQNGTVLADCLDRARALLPYDMMGTDPRHGGKVSP